MKFRYLCAALHENPEELGPVDFFSGTISLSFGHFHKKNSWFPFEVHHVYRDFQGPIFECHQNHLYMEHVS